MLGLWTPYRFPKLPSLLCLKRVLSVGWLWVALSLRGVPLTAWGAIFYKGFGGDYGVTLTPEQLQYFCEVEWPAYDVG